MREKNDLSPFLTELRNIQEKLFQLETTFLGINPFGHNFNLKLDQNGEITVCIQLDYSVKLTVEIPENIIKSRKNGKNDPFPVDL